jgi:hypothetical protein
LNGQPTKSLRIIPKAVKKPKNLLTDEIPYVIKASKDVNLSNITLRENHPLTKTEHRLSTNLDGGDFAEWMNEEICLLGASKVTEDMVIGIDPPDNSALQKLLREDKPNTSVDNRGVLLGLISSS